MSSSPRIDLPNFKSPAKARAEDKAPVKPVSYEIHPPGGGQTGAGAAAPVPGVQPFPATASGSRLPLLPRSKRPAISSHRHDANPALAIKVLQDIHIAVEGWHQALRQIVLDIQALYMEGPMVEGWLESALPHPGKPAAAIDSRVLRHADPQDLGGYVDRLCDRPAVPSPGAAPDPGQYHLCSLDVDGQIQCQLCPPDQLMVVSQAIARHQQLRQLLNDKQYLEAKLKRAVETLSQVRTDLGIAPGPDTPVEGM